MMTNTNKLTRSQFGQLDEILRDRIWHVLNGRRRIMRGPYDRSYRGLATMAASWRVRASFDRHAAGQSADSYLGFGAAEWLPVAARKMWA